MTEYILPKIDHQDQDAVILGYGVYKERWKTVSSGTYQEELYKTRRAVGNDNNQSRTNGRIRAGDRNQKILTRRKRASGKNEEINQGICKGRGKIKDLVRPKRQVLLYQGNTAMWKDATTLMGYLPYLETGTILGIIIVLVACVMLFVYVSKIKKTLSITGKGKGRRTRQTQRDNRKSKLPTDQTDQSQNTIQSVVKSTINQSGNHHSCMQIMERQRYYCQQRKVSGPASLVSKEPGELATIYINEDLTVIES